ncbi:outer membrane beta-barrel protein [Fulvitalea axinellae]
MRRILLSAVAILVMGVNFGFAQGENTEKKRGMPDLPGDLFVEFGWNWINSTPSNMGTKWFSSRAFNVYYTYGIPIGKSKFSFNPGIGIGVENYSFSEDVTLKNNNGQTEIVTIQSITETYTPVDKSPVPVKPFEGASINKTNLQMTYLDIPLEFRYSSLGPNSRKGFKMALGGKVGYLIDSKTKIKYKKDGETKTVKYKEDFNLEKFRYGVYGRVGFGWINLYYYQNLSSMFESGKGPSETDATTSQVGLSFDLF